MAFDEDLEAVANAQNREALVGLLDDIAALAKLAAASIDDVGAAAGRASVKAAGVVVDDTAVTPRYVHGLEAERELPIIRRIAIGSLRNKLLIILPAVLLLSSIAPTVVEVILILGGCYLSCEGAHKIIHALRHDDKDHEVPSAQLGPDAEAATIAGAIRTDFILSAEIIAITLGTVDIILTGASFASNSFPRLAVSYYPSPRESFRIYVT